MNIRDIANLAGVSASTVSKVMNGKDKDISEETRKKVLEVIEREHYVPYFKFLDKAGMKNRLVGLILQKNNQEKERYIAVAERIARENNYGLVIGYSEDENDTKILCQDMILKKVSGILTEDFVNIADKREKGVIVNYNDTSGLNELNETIFYYKISEAVELAVENFVQEGHQKIACIVNKSQIGLLKDYKLAMQNKNMQINPAWMYIYEEIEEFGISQFIGESETAIICGTPEIACRVAGILEKRKTNIPEELSIIAIGEGKELQYVSGGITAIDFPIEEMVSEGTKCLFEMDKTGQKTDTVRMCSPQIIHRNSVAPPLREKQGEKIIVVGSMNIDVTIEADKIPGEGENQMAKVWKLVISGIIIALVGTITATPITVFFFGGATGGGASMLAAGLMATGKQILESVLSVYIVTESVGKLISVFIAYFIIKAIPERSLVKYKYGEKFIKTKSN